MALVYSMTLKENIAIYHMICDGVWQCCMQSVDLYQWSVKSQDDHFFFNLLDLFTLFYVYKCFFLHVCKHTMYGPDICRGQMGALGPPGLELQLVVGHHVSAEGWEWNLILGPP